MDETLAKKLRIMADAAKYGLLRLLRGAEAQGPDAGGLGSTTGSGICHAYTHAGRALRLAAQDPLDQYCLFDCAYCVNRRSSNVRRARFTVEEVVTLTIEFYNATTSRALPLVRDRPLAGPHHGADASGRKALRREHGFRGYIHPLKTIPEASPWLVEQAGLWADRLSINLELPTETSLARLAPEKTAPRSR